MKSLLWLILSFLCLSIIARPNEDDLNFYLDDDEDYNTDHLIDLTKSNFLNQWHCETLSDIGLIIRYYHGEVECLSKDGKQCILKPDPHECEELIKKYGSGETSLRCGEMHKQLFGSIGYGYPDHWCAQAAKNLYPFLKYEISPAWRCELLKHLGVIVRYIEGDIECLSHDGKNCVWNTSFENCLLLTTDKEQVSKIHGLRCGEKHNEKWSGPGYNTPGHWCGKALQFYKN